MTRKLVPAETLIAKWRKDPAYRKAHAELAEEYRLASALIGARAEAGLTQEQVAERMGTTATAVSRLESGKANPSARTLERYAKATGHELRITLEPIDVGQPPRKTRPGIRLKARKKVQSAA
jgi:transcriptional regulator with XRE-family HTH domain